MYVNRVNVTNIGNCRATFDVINGVQVKLLEMRHPRACNDASSNGTCYTVIFIRNEVFAIYFADVQLFMDVTVRSVFKALARCRVWRTRWSLTNI